MDRNLKTLGITQPYTLVTNMRINKSLSHLFSSLSLSSQLVRISHSISPKHPSVVSEETSVTLNEATLALSISDNWGYFLFNYILMTLYEWTRHKKQQHLNSCGALINLVALIIAVYKQ